MTVRLVILAFMFSVVVALYLWSRHSEAGIDYEHTELPADQADALRLGIALAAQVKNSQ